MALRQTEPWRYPSYSDEGGPDFPELPTGRFMQREKHSRSVTKAITWRFIATMTTVVLVYVFTGRLAMALEVGGLELTLKLLFYFLHERGWGKIRWGKVEVEPFVVWITGFSGAGKTSIAEGVAKALEGKGLKVDHLDGENIRELFPKTGFTRDEVNMHIERVGLLASRLEKSGVFVMASFISPYKESREFVRNICENYIEVHLATPVEVCEERDPSGLYRRARAGEVTNLPGVDVEYELPEYPVLEIDTSKTDTKEAVRIVMKHLKKFL